MLDEFRHSIRLLRRSPVLTVASVCTLAVAIGASTAVFSVIDKVLVRPLPIDEPARVVIIWARERLNSGSITEFSYPTFPSWQRDARTFEGLAAVGSVNWSLILREGEPVTLPVAAVSASFFPVMKTPAVLGRALLPTDDQPGAERVAVMRHDTWRHRFSADPDIVGRPLRFNDAVYTVVGVMPDGFEYPAGAELWVPLVPQLADASAKDGYDLLTNTGVGFLSVLGRLHPNVLRDAAHAEISGFIARDTDTVFRPGIEPVLTPLDQHILGTTKPALLALAFCVGLVLLIACANVAVLLLARAAAHVHETATRLAIGATRWHIVRQSLADALLVSILGSAIGLVVSHWTIDVVVAMAPADVLRLDTVRFDARAFAFAGVVCVIATILVGLAPGLQTSRWSLADVLGQNSSRIVRSHRLRRTFVVAQVALAFVLLVCGGLVARSFANLLRVDMGFEPLNVLTLDVTVPDVPADRYNRFYTELLAHIRAMPGVDEVGAIFLRPLEHTGIGSDVPVLIEGQPADLQSRDSERNPVVNFETVTAGYFRAMGIRVVRGRAFSETDSDRTPRVAIVSAGLAERLWPGDDPIGRRIIFPPLTRDLHEQQEWPMVVGVVHDVRYRGITDPRFDLYVPNLQHPNHAVKHVVVRTTRDPSSLVRPIRAEARRLESAALVENVSTMDQLVARAIAPWRFSASTLGALSVLALALAWLGIYAVISQSVVERTREIGIRIAIGAVPRQIAVGVLREGLSLTAAGIVIGLIGGIAVGQVLTKLLYEVRALDPLTLAGVATLFTVTSTLAILRPLWRATRVDPVLALRQQ